MPHSDDTTDDPSPEGTLDEEFEYCACCGAKLPADEWCPVLTETNGAGELVVRSFCDETCRSAWVDEESSRTP